MSKGQQIRSLVVGVSFEIIALFVSALPGSAQTDCSRYLREEYMSRLQEYNKRSSDYNVRLSEYQERSALYQHGHMSDQDRERYAQWLNGSYTWLYEYGKRLEDEHNQLEQHKKTCHQSSQQENRDEQAYYSKRTTERLERYQSLQQERRARRECQRFSVS